MNTPETKLTVKTTDGAYQPDSLLSFNHANREVLRITHDGRMIIGEGLSVDGATQVAAKMLIDAFEQEIQKMVDARVAAEREQVRVLREALDYVDRQVHDAWPINANTYSETHRMWCIDKARAALDATKEDSK